MRAQQVDKALRQKLVTEGCRFSLFRTESASPMDRRHLGGLRASCSLDLTGDQDGRKPARGQRSLRKSHLSRQDAKTIASIDLRAGKGVSRCYRNRRIGEFLKDKELDLTEGRSTGINKILIRPMMRPMIPSLRWSGSCLRSQQGNLNRLNSEKNR